jgi:type I restriction enzyme R subunit
VRDQLTDPRFYEQMSKLLDDLIKQSRTDAAEYEAFLKNAEALVKRMARQSPEAGTPRALHGKPLASVVYTNLPWILTGNKVVVREESPREIEENAELALAIDLAMREQAPAGWKEDSDGPKGKQVLNALFPLMNRDRRATLALFDLIKNQPGI